MKLLASDILFPDGLSDFLMRRSECLWKSVLHDHQLAGRTRP
ncbi:Hypothetical Protein RSKD131_3811 [Cereibacter sphaeroides KD131]|nr:Hypothetical Protein RSKD131_3811 [Cereibacter sphaeroides KD131]